MKNSIITLLAVALLFFLAHALGVFDFGSFIDREYRNQYAEKRTQAVHAAPAWKLAIAYDEHDRPTKESVQGAVLAAELINKNGGVLGRPIELIIRNQATTLPQYNAAVQSFCNDFSVAAVIGPYRSGDIPSARALTQFQGMPLVSPTTVASEKLPPLEPDNFVTFFPPLSAWVEVLLSDMEKRGFREVLLVSPESGSYGDIFCTAIERASRNRLGGSHVMRINYQSPLRMHKIINTLRNYTHENGIDAIFFGGKHADYLEFGHLMKNLGITRPVYISDDAYLPGHMASPGVQELLLPMVNIEDLPAEFRTAWQATHGKQDLSYHAALNAITVYAIAQAITENGGYHPEAITETLLRLRDSRAHSIILEKKSADAQQ